MEWIAITNRKLTNDLKNQIQFLLSLKNKPTAIILREKDLQEQEYENLARDIVNICADSSVKLILHTHIEVASRLGIKRIHLPYETFKAHQEELTTFDVVGVSTHTLMEAKECLELGASYVTYSHIFVTDCKKGLAPKGIDDLKNVCAQLNGKVYALGGIDEHNAKACIDAGATGVCIMSKAMTAIDEIF